MAKVYKVTRVDSRGEQTANSFFTEDVTQAMLHAANGNKVEVIMGNWQHCTAMLATTCDFTESDSSLKILWKEGKEQ